MQAKCTGVMAPIEVVQSKQEYEMFAVPLREPLEHARELISESLARAAKILEAGSVGELPDTLCNLKDIVPTTTLVARRKLTCPRRKFG